MAIPPPAPLPDPAPNDPNNVRWLYNDPPGHDVGADIGLAVNQGIEVIILPDKEYNWNSQVNLGAGIQQNIIVLGGGPHITTLRSQGPAQGTDPGKFFTGGINKAIMFVGLEFWGQRRNEPGLTPETTPLGFLRDFVLFKAYNCTWHEGGHTGLKLSVTAFGVRGEVDLYDCVFDKNGVHGLELDAVGNFHLIKPVAQENGKILGYGIYCHNNREPGIIRGAHVERHCCYSQQSPSDWGINVSYGNNVGVYEAYCAAGGRIWVDHSSCDVHNSGVETALFAQYGPFALEGPNPGSQAMICGGAHKQNNYDAAKLPTNPPVTCA